MSDIQKRSAGATVQHKSVFGHLVSYENEEDITQEFREKWIIPYYFHLNDIDEAWIENMVQVKNKITDGVIQKCLGDFNWRSRSTGAYFAAITNRKEYADVIGVHLLKSEVCCAGAEYAKVLASFNNNLAIKYLNDYLEFYLTKPELYFDQIEVITAMKYLDEINDTDLTSLHKVNWNAFIEKKRAYSLKQMEEMKATIELTAIQLKAIEQHANTWTTEIDTKAFSERVDLIKRLRDE
ncbi:MAG: DUF6000 family protein [Bacteroidota bacterium]